MRRRRAIALAWVLAALVVLALLVKSFVADVYRVDSGSMRPTLFGGRDRPDGEEDAEHVLVLYERDLEPQRFDLVVIRSPDGSKPLVKRVCGLPLDQTLAIRDGDLFIDGARLPPEAPRPAPVPVYEDRWLDPERFFEHRRDGSVRRAKNEWVVDGGSVPPGSMLLYHPALRDDYLDREHRRVPGVVEVNDAVLELEFLLEGPLAAQKLRFQLVEAGDTFEVVLAAGERSETAVQLLRRGKSRVPPELMVEAPAALEPGRWCRLSFSNIDNHLRVRAPELGVELGRSYAEDDPGTPASAAHRPGDTAMLPPGMRTIGARVLFGVEGGRARFRAVRILRDLYYTDDGRFGTCAAGTGGDGGAPSPVSLGPDDYFLLGDNSAASTDSRHFGPVKGSELIGRPLAVVWPEPRWLQRVGR